MHLLPAGGYVRQDNGRAALGVVLHGRIDAEDAQDVVGRQDVGGGAVGGDAAMVKENQALAVAGGEIEVVGDAKYGHAAFFVERLQ